MTEDRLEKILALLEEQRAVSVNELKDKLYVSAATVRRDLAELEKRGQIERSFGGAVAKNVPSMKPKQQDDKSKAYTGLAYTASQMIQERSTVFIGSGAALTPIISMLGGRKGLTVVTDSELIAGTLCGTVDRVVCCGGKYLPSYGIFAGKQAAELAAHYRYDFAFFTCEGLTLDGAVWDSCMEKLPLIKVVCNRAKSCVMLCPREVLGRTASYQLMDMRSINTVITDAPDLLIQFFRGTVIESS